MGKCGVLHFGANNLCVRRIPSRAISASAELLVRVKKSVARLRHDITGDLCNLNDVNIFLVSTASIVVTFACHRFSDNASLNAAVGLGTARHFPHDRAQTIAAAWPLSAAPLAKAEIPREHFPRNILARMSATSRACRASGISRTTRHTDSTTPQQTAGRLIR